MLSHGVAQNGQEPGAERLEILELSLSCGARGGELDLLRQILAIERGAQTATQEAARLTPQPGLLRDRRGLEGLVGEGGQARETAVSRWGIVSALRM